MKMLIGKKQDLYYLPFLEFHASHLAFAVNSKNPGLSAQHRSFTFVIIR